MYSPGHHPLLMQTPHPCSHRLRLPDSPVPVCRRRHAQLLLHITAEMGERREIHPVGNFLQRDVFLEQQARYLVGGEAVYPVGGGLAAHLLADFRQVVGSDAKPGGIMRKATAPDVLPVVEQLHKPPQQVAVAFRNIMLGLAAGMDIIKVEHMDQKQMPQHFFMKQMTNLAQPFAKPPHIFQTNATIMGRQLHYRIQQ